MHFVQSKHEKCSISLLSRSVMNFVLLYPHLHTELPQQKRRKYFSLSSDFKCFSIGDISGEAWKQVRCILLSANRESFVVLGLWANCTKANKNKICRSNEHSPSLLLSKY